MKFSSFNFLARYRNWRRTVTHQNAYWIVLGFLPAAIVFFVAQGVFNRTLVPWLTHISPVTPGKTYPPGSITPESVLPWVLLTTAVIWFDFLFSLWLSFRTFRFIWKRFALTRTAGTEMAETETASRTLLTPTRKRTINLGLIGLGILTAVLTQGKPLWLQVLLPCLVITALVYLNKARKPQL
jgi:hypothetical protein